LVCHFYYYFCGCSSFCCTHREFLDHSLVGFYHGSLTTPVVLERSLSKTNYTVSSALRCEDLKFWVKYCGNKEEIACFSSEKSRLHIWLSGIDAHLYNSSIFCQKMAESNTERGETSSLMNEKGSHSISQHNVNDLKKEDVFYNMFWSFVGNVQIVLSSVKIIVGNHLLPTVLLAQMESSRSHVSWRRSEGDGPLRLVHQTNANDVEISFLKCEEFNMSKACRLNARSGPPPRTMGQGFSLLHCSSLKLQSQQTVLGIFETDEAPSHAPHCNIFIDLGSDVEIAYGPWADAQRLILMEFFYPIDYRIAEISLPLTTSESGSEVSLRCVFEGFVCSTSLAFRKLFQSDVINANITAQFPRVYNGIQNWTLSFRFWRTSACAEIHYQELIRRLICVLSLQDLLNEISSEAVNDIFAFVPTIWKFDIECSDFEIIFILNDKNWIDARDDHSFITSSNSLQHQKARPQGWIDFWRTESVTVIIDFMYHPFYQIQQSDLPERAIPPQFTAKPSHPFKLEEDTLDITVNFVLAYREPFFPLLYRLVDRKYLFLAMGFGSPRISLTIILGCIIRYTLSHSNAFLRNATNVHLKKKAQNYALCFFKVSDIDSYKAHTRLSRRMFGDVREPIELYRPLRLKMCIRVQNVRAHCLIHSVQTDGPVPGDLNVDNYGGSGNSHPAEDETLLKYAPAVIFKFIAVCTFGGAMFFERSRSFPSATEGFLTADSLSFRGHALLSEDGISWDAGSIEYAWIVEVIIGNIVGKLHPTQVVMLFQFLETVHVMTNATDEELLVSERYDLCQHMNDIRTCSHSNLGLTDAAFRTQNCESADKLEYKLVRGGIDSVSLCLIEEQYAAELTIAPTRASVCNCHESSFCSSILLGVLNINVRLFARAPNEIAHSSGNWLECAKFYFEDIELEVQLPYAKEEEHLLRERKRFLSKHDRVLQAERCINFEEVTQAQLPDYISSLSLLCSLVDTQADFYKSMDVTRNFPHDRFGAYPDYSELMRRSILFCPPLMKSYCSLLAAFTFDIPHVDVPAFGVHGAINEWAINVSPIITKRRDGVNELELRQRNARKSVETSTAASPPLQEKLDPAWGSNSSVLYVKGKACTLAKMFVTPLGLETVEKLCGHASVALIALHPSFIVQRIYAGCAAARHLQPLTATVLTGLKKSSIEDVCARVGLPSVDLVIFQSAVVERHTNPMESDVHLLPLRSGTVTVLLRESSLAVSTKENGADILCQSLSFKCTLHGHAQVSTMLDSRSYDCFSIKPTKYVSNWSSLNIRKRLGSFALRPIIDGDLPQVGLSGIIECERSTRSLQLRQVNIDFSKPWLHVAFGKTSNDVFKKHIFPLYEMAFSMLAAWIYCWHRLYTTVRNAVADYEEWIDLAFAKILTDAARYKDELFVSMDKSAMNELKRYAKATSCCASCKLMLLLLKYEARVADNPEQRVYWTQIRRAANNAGLMLKPIRKLAIVATLNEWQQFIAPHIKIPDVFTARKYVESRKTGHNDRATDPTSKTMSEAQAVPGELTSAMDVKPSELILPVFFWSIFEKLKLHENNLNGSFLAEMSAFFSFTVDDFKVNIVEQRMLDVSDRNITSCTTRQLFAMESFRSSGHLSHHFIMDEHRLRPIKQEPDIDANPTMIQETSKHRKLISVKEYCQKYRACLEIYYNCEIPRLSANISPATWRFLNEIVIVRKYCARISAAFNRHIETLDIGLASSNTRSNAGAMMAAAVSSANSSYSWTRCLLNAIRTYQLNKPDAATHTSKAGTLRFSAEGAINLAAVSFLSALDNVNVLLEFNSTQVRHKSVHDNSPAERQSSDVLYTTVETITAELTTGVHIGVGVLTRSSCKVLQWCLRREYDGKAFRNNAELKLEETLLSTTVDAHRMAAVFGKCLTKWMKEAASGGTEVLGTTGSENAEHGQTEFQLDFVLTATRVEVSAKISSTISIQYTSQGVRLTAELPKKSEVLLLKHSLAFIVIPTKNLQEQRMSTKCALSLPALCIKREMLNTDEEECLIIGNENVRYKEGPYSSIIVSIGGCEETVSIDFISLLLLTKECVEAELPVVEEAVTMQPAAANEDDTNTTAAANATKKLFNLQVSLLEPSLCAYDQHEQIKPTKTIAGQTRKSKMPSSSSGVRWMNLTISDANSVAVRFTIERLSFFATNRWISYEDGKTKRFIHELELARKYWSTHRQKHFGNVAIPLAPTISDSAVPTVEETRRTMYLTVTITEGANVYVPLYSKNLLPHTSAISNDLWTHSLDGMGSCSYIVFPRGTCKIATKLRENAYSGVPKRLTSIQCSVKGMTANISSTIGCIVGSLSNTLTSAEEHILDVWDRERMMLSMPNKERDNEVDPENVLSTIVHPEEKLHWLEQKMYDQTRKLDELARTATRGGHLEREKMRLKKFALVRMQQFRHSMLDRLKRHKIKRTGGDGVLLLQDESGSKSTAEILDDPQCVMSAGKSSEDLSATASVTGEQSEATNSAYTTSSTQSTTTPTGTETSTPTQSSEKMSFREMASPAALLSDDDNIVVGSNNNNIDIQSSEPSVLQYRFVADLGALRCPRFEPSKLCVESGECILRSENSIKRCGWPVNLEKSPDEKLTYTDHCDDCTKITIPCVRMNSYFSSEDRKRTSSKQNQSPRSLYLSVELSGMPEETPLTPVLSSYVQQLLNAIPQNATDRKSEEFTGDSSDSSSNSRTGSLIARLDTRISLDLLISLTVQSCAIRFEGRQQKTAAMDLLLRLPSLKFFACRRRTGDADSMYLSMTLKSFSINFYNPNQPSPVDALSLSLDKFSFSVSRVSDDSSRNIRVRFPFTYASSIAIGVANFTYDIRRLSELIAFPRPWYRRSIPRLPLTPKSSIPRSQQPQAPLRTSAIHTSVPDHSWNIEWSMSVQGEAINAHVQMSTTMGDTKWNSRDICLSAVCLLNSNETRDINIRLKIPSSLITAQGGAAAGSVSLTGACVEFCQNLLEKPATTMAKCTCERLGARVEWMGRAVLNAAFKETSVSLFDDWCAEKTADGKVSKASVIISGNVHWHELKIIVTKATFSNTNDIVTKFLSFFREQIRNSRTMWISTRSSTLSRKKARRGRMPFETSRDTWVHVLDLLTELQSAAPAFPMPSGEHGLTTIDARFVIDAGSVTAALMNGDLNAPSWALVQIGNLLALFFDEAHYAFLDGMNTLGVNLSQRLIVSLSPKKTRQQVSKHQHTINAVYKVECGQSSVLPKTWGIEGCLEHCIDRPLEQFQAKNNASEDSNAIHYSVLELFEVPPLDSVMMTVQSIPLDKMEAQKGLQKVATMFSCKFHGSLGVQTDFSTQVSFLPELIKSYMPSKVPQRKFFNMKKHETGIGFERTDDREFICERWSVQPRIRFIDNVKWDPPVIDEILRKLQIFDHRATIPKVIQRGVLDRCDLCMSRIFLALIEFAKKRSSNARSAPSA
uniref:Bridge-like lipid transfer protein family member 1 C-terminal domain-containing protein n=1 Tax=Ascaris lumbricoides TaxID=6252 RepID=A0A9J2P2Q7_ASCLU